MSVKNLNICVISPGLPIPPSKGGAVEMLIFETIKYYQNSNVCVYSEQTKAEDVSKFNTDNIKYIQFSVSPVLNKLQKNLNRLARRGLFFLYDYFFIRKILKNLDSSPDIFHLHNNFYYIPYLKRRFPKSRIILQMHNDFLFENKFLYSTYVNILMKVDLVIAVSNYVRERIIRDYKECEKKILVVYNGVSLELFKKLSMDDPSLIMWKNKLKIKLNERVIIFVGRLCEIKGVHILISAFIKLIENSPNTKLLIVGSSWFAEAKPSPYLKRIQRLSKEFEDKIIFTGFVSHSDLNFLYNLSLICVVPSVFNEPFGLVNLEAMASGCAIIGSRIGGIPEILKNKETGLLVESNNVDDLCVKIQYLLDDDLIRKNLIQNAMNSVQKNFDWKVVAQNYESIYFQLIKRNLSE